MNNTAEALRKTLDEWGEMIGGRETRCTVCGMPLVEGGHNCPALTTMPSRDFLIRQAVLNWLQEDYPATMDKDGPAPILRCIFGDDPVYLGPLLARLVLRRYRALVAVHGGQPCR